tara:strand:- start:256 stop:1350 length:1095 start_codon:yes stop_codon:yes gene_type:complete
MNAILNQIKLFNIKPIINMSRIYKRERSPYYWWASSFNGKNFRKSTKVKQVSIAKKIQSKWDVMLATGDLSFLGKNKNIPSNISIEEFILSFLNLRSRISINAYKTAKTVLNNLKSYLKKEKASSLDEITLQILNKYVDWLTCSPKTKKNYLQVISLFLNQAVKEKIIKENISKDVTLPRIIKNDLHRNLEDKDLEIIFSNSCKWDLYFRFLYFTGLRAGDVSMLKYENIDREQKAINSLVRKSRRIHKFPLANSLIELIPENVKNSDPIFPELYSEDESKLNDNLAKPRKYMQKMLKDNDREKATLHSFRTTYNNILRNLGLAIEDRQILLAHSASETTKIYTHPNFELARDFINKIPSKNIK